MSAATEFTEDEIGAALDALRSGWLTMGPRIEELEELVAERFGVATAVAVSSGTSALQLAVRAAGVGPGDSVVAAPFAGAEVEVAVRDAGARLLLADVDGALTGEAVLAVAGERTKAVIASHLFGVPCDLRALRALCEERGWLLIEDATDAFGATLPDGRLVGATGHLGCLSLAAGRLIGVGEGGLVVGDDATLTAEVRNLRAHCMTSVTWDRHRGHAESYDITGIGFNFRMDEPRAALTIRRMERVQELVEARRAAAHALTGVEPAAGAAPQHAVVATADAAARAALVERLQEAGVPVAELPARLLPPRAQQARERLVVVDLGALEVLGLAPAQAGPALAGAS